MEYPDVLSIAKTAERCRIEGIPLSQKTIRRFVKDGTLPAIQTGKKSFAVFPECPQICGGWKWQTTGI